MSENIKYRQLKAFAAVVETGSFKSGAERLAVTQPSFSALIKELEHDVGVSLCDRTTRRCAPTDAGLSFYYQTKGLLADLEAAYRHLKAVGAGNSGHLSLATSPSLCSGIITEKLAEFQRRYPGVRLTLRERKAREVLDAVRQGEVEFGIGGMLQPDTELVFRPLFTDRLKVIAPRGHVLVRMRRGWKSLDGLNLIMLTGGPSEHAIKINRVEPRQILEVEHGATALAMVRQGMGVTVLPSSITSGLNATGLELLNIPGKLAERAVGVISKKGTKLSEAARNFSEMFKRPSTNRRRQ